MEFTFALLDKFSKHTNLEDFKRSFNEFLDKVIQNSVDYQKEYLKLMIQIKPQQKSLLNECPSSEEIRKNYDVFLQR